MKFTTKIRKNKISKQHQRKNKRPNTNEGKFYNNNKNFLKKGSGPRKQIQQ